MSKKFLLALLIIGAIAAGLITILVIGLFAVDEDGRSRDNGAPSSGHVFVPTPLV